jgi:diguanylate cyclase (GGDEF)-like protein
MRHKRLELIRSLFDEYIEMYASRDDRLITRFSDDFSGLTGSGDFLVRDREEWVKITRQDFAQVTGRIRIEMVDLWMQDLCDDVVAVTACFHIHLPVPEPVFSREMARLVLVFRLESGVWKIVHSGISVQYQHAKSDEVYPMASLHERGRELEVLVEDRTRALEEANDQLEEANDQLEEVNHQLEALSYIDALTGVANRRSFDRMLAQEWNRGRRAGTPLAVVMLDVDNFKHFNDQYGHPAGDACLKALAQALVRAARRAGDGVARYGGEEFVVLVPNTSGRDALLVAERIQSEVWSEAIPHSGAPTGIVTVSLGVASVVPSKQGTAEDLVRDADSELYRAKQEGRNCVRSAEIALSRD